MKKIASKPLTERDLGYPLLRLQKALGWVTMLFLLASFAVLVDGLTAEMRRGPNRIDVLPGSATPLSGPIPVKTAELEDFQVQGNSLDGQVRLELDDFFSSYWYGSGMWRGRLVVGDNPGIGEYHFVVEFADAPPQSVQNYRVVVWDSVENMRQGAFSRVTRETGLNPFWTAGCLFPMGLAGAMINFFMGRRRAWLLLKSGCAEIYKVVRSKTEGLEVAFGMGEQQGVAMGQECEILRPDGSVVGRGSVMLCEARYAGLILPLDFEVDAGYLARPVLDNAPTVPRSLLRTGAPLAPQGVLHG